MSRIVQAASLAGVIFVGGCRHPQPTAQSIAGTPARAAMDSAEIERLCLHPDSVRAGRADCVLKDQGIMGERRLPAPATPPR